MVIASKIGLTNGKALIPISYGTLMWHLGWETCQSFESASPTPNCPFHSAKPFATNSIMDLASILCFCKNLIKPVLRLFYRQTSLSRSPSCRPSRIWCKYRIDMTTAKKKKSLVTFAAVEPPWQWSGQALQEEEARGSLWCTDEERRPRWKMRRSSLRLWSSTSTLSGPMMYMGWSLPLE